VPAASSRAITTAHDRVHDRVHDTAEVTDLVHRLALYSDKASLEQWSTLIADHVFIDLFGMSAQGKEACVESSGQRRASGRSGPGSGGRHLVTSCVIDVGVDGDGDRATGDITVLFYANAHTAPELKLVVNYADEYVRTPDGWKLSRRIAPSPVP
jgi:HIP---CoA ligase